MMLVKTIDSSTVLQFPNLVNCSNLWHGIFTRRGGMSRGPFQGLNVSFLVGDKNDIVLRNRKTVARCAGSRRLFFVRQVHGAQVLVLSEDKTSLLDNSASLTPPVSDAMVTDLQGTSLVIQAADCQAVLLYDPIRRVAANIHAGWRGSVMNIIGRTIAVMKTAFGSRPVDIIAGIGPSLGPCCAEFTNYQHEIPRQFWAYKMDHNHFDFWSLSKDQLCLAGVPMARIHVSSMCTKCRTDLFFSYRQEKTTGRFAAVIGLK